MKLTEIEKNEIEAAAVCARMTGNESTLNQASKAVLKISQVNNYGEVTGQKFNRNLRTESNAYGYVIRGVSLDIQSAIAPISTILEGYSVSEKFNSTMKDLNDIFEQSVERIEKAYPKAKGHLNNRIREVRAAAKEYIVNAREVCTEILSALPPL